MIDSITRITLNLQETNTMVSIRAKRGDTGRKLLIHLSDGSIPYHISDDCYATFTAKKPDGTKINNACTIENNVIEYEFTDQTCTAVGTMKAEIRLYGADDKMITSACFLVNVYDTVFRDGDEVGSETEMNTLDDLILRANAFLNETGKLLRWQGNWDSETEYESNDLVLHEEVLYVAEEAIAAGTVPGSEGAAWVPIAGMGTGSGADLTEQVDRAEAAAQNAESAAATANNARAQAQAAANSAGVYVGNAVAAMNNANAAAATAEAAKESVSTSVNLAGGYASTAHSSANQAEQAKNSAQGYASSASSSATRAEEAAARAEEAAAEAGNGSGGNVDLTGYATEQWVKDQKYLTEVPEGYAKTEDIPTKPEDIGALPSTYTPPNQTAEQVGADPKGTAASAVSQHNTAEDSHNDIRLELKAINDRLTAFFDSDNQTLDELSEIVAYITNNKTLIESITTSKVNVADIINNLTTNVSNKPLSAAQGVVLKGLIDTLSGNLANYQPKGDYALRSELPNVPTKLSEFTNDSGFITGYTETDPTVPAWAKQSEKPSYSKSEVGLGNVANERQYSAKNPPPYPVTSVNGKTGDVIIEADKYDPTVYGLPVLHLTGDTTGMSKDNAVTLSYAYGENSGSCTLKWQGSSSLAYDKKNYTIKLDSAIDVGWGSQKKYCLKANYIDHTHARNIVSARLWGQMVASRSGVHSTLKSCPNYGAVDGFPIAIMLNGEFHGLYTWNIPKDKWTFNMGSGTQEAVICANYDTPAVDLRVHAKVDGSDHELEEVTDENNSAWVATSLNNLIDKCVNSYGADLDTTIAQYMDWNSAIDYLILTVLIDGRDMYKKNYIMVTYDGTKWIWSAYDMDSTYGLQWAGKEIYPANDGISFVKFRVNRVMELIYRFKTNALKSRYKTLRSGILSEENLSVMFENFVCGIPSTLYDADVRKWTSVPGSSVVTVDQILRWLHRRLAVVDKWIEELPAQETPIAPENREGNVVPVATDTSGSIYNGTGYKNGFTINSLNDGTETEVAMDGCCITGFIPVTKENVIKVTTDHWNISPTNSRIIFYDMDLKPMAYYTQHGFVGWFNGYTNKTAILDKTNQSVTYNADGTTTLNIAYGANCTNLGYIRIRGVGNGANLAVIREGEIPEHAPDFEPEVVIDNWIPVSTDASGAIYNSVGYKDNTRTKTDTPDEEETKSGMFQTGFIPFKMTDTLRISSSAWGTSPSNAKVLICNAQFKAMGHYTANGYVSAFNGYTNGAESNVTSLKTKEFQSVTVGDDGFTTINLAYGDECTDVAYVRITGCGSGANAVVKIN